jgi:hypothetical protein
MVLNTPADWYFLMNHPFLWVMIFLMGMLSTKGIGTKMYPYSMIVRMMYWLF